MKKQLLVAVMTLIPALSFAKVSDFDEIITENFKVQSALHSTVKSNLKEARTVEAEQPAARERIVVVEKSGTSYNAPTKADLLAFKKEKRAYRPSEDKQFERLAGEVHNQE